MVLAVGLPLLFAVVVMVAGLQSIEANTYFNCPTGITLNPVIPKGNLFFDSVTKEFFPIKGIAYYPRPNAGPLSFSNSVDFFTDDFRSIWETDIEYLRQLGVNTIRIYGVDPSKNHDNFMCALQQAGIYVVVGLLADCEDCGIGPNEAPSCYPASLKNRGQFIINEFSKYTNTLVFSAGNEVTLYARGRQIELNAACQKRFLRDMRFYVSTCSAIPASILPRKVPIGMVNWDRQRIRQAQYFNCRTDPMDFLENAEWYGLNAYRHCDVTATSTEDLSGWISLRQDFEAIGLSVPVMIAEYGCRERFPTIGNFEAQRTWLQVDAIYSPDYIDVFAGGVVFEYSAEKYIVDTSDQGKPWPYNEFMKLQYGVGFFSPVDCDHLGSACIYTPYPEFNLLREKLENIDVSFMPNFDAYVPKGEIPECPLDLPSLSDFYWPSDDAEDLPCYLAPTSPPTFQPSMSSEPSSQPSVVPTPIASSYPTNFPSTKPSVSPSSMPSTASPTKAPIENPTMTPSSVPTINPSSMPTINPSLTASLSPTQTPSFSYSSNPTNGVDGRGSSPEPTPKPTSVFATIDAPAAFSQFNDREGNSDAGSNLSSNVAAATYSSDGFHNQPRPWLSLIMVFKMAFLFHFS